MRIIPCVVCGDEFKAVSSGCLYCVGCRRERALEAKRERNRKRGSRAGEFCRGLDMPVAESRKVKVKVKRAKTLASTPEIPAAAMDRDYQLTGGATAVSHGASMGLISVGI